MDRRSLVASVAAGMATLVAPGRDAAAQQHRVNQIVATVSFAFLPLYVAEHMGFFREEGVQLNTVRVQTAAAGMAAVVSGDGHYYVSTPATGARATAQGADVQVFAALMQQYSSSVVLARPVAERLGITAEAPLERRLAALRGLRIAAHSPGSQPDMLVRHIARQQGWDPARDIQILPITFQNILPALEQNRIDGFVYSSPLAETAVLRYGAVQILNAAAGEYPPLRDFLSIALIGNGRWLREQPDAAAAVVRAVWRAMDLMTTDPESARRAARRSFADLEQEVFDLGFEVNRRAFGTSPRVTREAMLANFRFQEEITGQRIDFDVDRTFTNAIVDRAAARR